jgi:hypothetical protein
MVTINQRSLNIKDATMEKIVINDQLCAIILRANYSPSGINFVTENHLSQQLAIMTYPTGKNIDPHTHNPVNRNVTYTQECLFIRKGKLRVDFYTSDHQYCSSKILCAGDVILLIDGGHGFHVIEDLEMIEVKQGPYVGELDKTRFNSKVIQDFVFN